MPFVLVLSATSAMACQSFPAAFVPFVNVSYISAPNSVGDRLVVGELVGDTNGILAIGANLPLAGAPNEMYCDAQVRLGPKSTYTNVYVPSAAERSGDFSPFAELLLDPLANKQPSPEARSRRAVWAGPMRFGSARKPLAFSVPVRVPRPGSFAPKVGRNWWAIL